MAFQIKSVPFINDSRELINIVSIASSTGVTTVANSLEVTDALTLIGAGASVTATTFYGSGAGLSDVLGADPGAGGGGETVINDDLQLSGSLEVQGATTLADLTFSTGSSFTFSDDSNAITGVGIGSDLGDATPSDAVLPTQKAVKEYVDGQIQETGGSITFSGDTGEESFDISDGSLTISGTPNEIVTAASALAPDGTLQIGLPDDVTVANSFTVTTSDITATAGNITAGGAVSGATASVTTDLTVGATLGTNGNALLEVISASDEVKIDGALNVSGNVDSASDLKLKENIEVIPNALEKVAALRGVSYNWKSNGELSAGIIAQEVQAVMPNIVKENESHLSVQYNGLIGLLIEGMKEQQAQIEELKAKLG